MKSRPLFILFHIVRFSLRVFLTVWNRLSLRGIENIPRKGGCILAANHVSFLDPPAVAAGALFRTVRFMARETLNTTPFWGWFIKRIATIPVAQDKGDVGALRKSLQVLKDGGCLALFPEGARSADGTLQPAKGGIGFLIARATVPVVPAYVDGSFRAFPRNAKWIRPSKVRVFYGKPILPAEFEALGKDRDGYEKVGQLVMDRIAALKPS
jgi:1-acyl-sn-glycerol-3-phosphate acyltransferase